jgi:hypothetical protein
MIMKRIFFSLLLVSFSAAAYANTTYNCSDASRSHEMQLTFTSDLSSVRYVAGPVSGPLTNAGIANRQGTQNAAIIYKDNRASATLTIQQSMLQAGAGSVTFSIDGDSTFTCNRR